MSPTPKLRRTLAVLTAGTIVIFGGLAIALTEWVRTPWRAEVLQREARTMQAVALMQISTAQQRLAQLGVPMSNTDVFAAVLESSRLSGVLRVFEVQLFDPAGQLREGLPVGAEDAGRIVPWWPRPLNEPIARFDPRGSLDAVLGLPLAPGERPIRTPLLEVVVPLTPEHGGPSYGVARYWIDGGALAAEFHGMDHRLFVQALTAFLGASAVIVLLVLWTYRRLAQAHEQLVARSADLARANQELDFAAKTGALGAISAHLIHGLKNPLAGLEGFVAEASVSEDDATRGQARETAMETARRLRAMVNEVVAVLRDEASGGADYPVPVRETLDAVHARAAATAAAAGVSLTTAPAIDAELNARTANLASLVLANLLTNAIEAARRGGEVRLQATQTDGMVEFVVTDTGPGLPPSVRNSLFRPVMSTKPGGGGMGLAISHRLARHAGGELELLRSDPAGTAFRLRVPAAGAPAAPLAGIHSSDSGGRS